MTIQPDLFDGKPALTAERLRELLHYDSETGALTWRVDRGNRKSGTPIVCVGNHGYIVVRIENVLYLAHRIIWCHTTGQWPICEIDHINRIRTDNRFSNLRPATSSQNKFNASAQSRNKSGHRGISFDKARSRWIARLKIRGVYVLQQRFTDKAGAIAARRAAELEHFGEFAPCHDAVTTT